jgi:hypothetical protein
MLKKILILPGWMNYLRMINVKEYSEIWKGKIDKNKPVDCVVGLSLGALVTLRDMNPNWKKIVLVGPPLPRRNILIWFFQWLKYVMFEGMSLKNQVFTKNPFRFIPELFNCVKLLSADFNKILDMLPADKIIVIRGKNDNFFCDNKAAQFLRSKNIRVIEVENAGHNWHEKFNEEINKIIK